MKKLIAPLLAVVMLLAACGVSAAGGSGSEGNAVEEMMYRGRVEEVQEDGSILVAQQPGFDYGQQSILFHLGEETVVEDTGLEVAEGAFVQVTYNGILTRSMPPQGNAQELSVIASHSEGVVVNGTIQQVANTDEGYSIHLLPFDAQDDSVQSQVVLQVPKDALEGIEEAGLVEGAEVSAVTRGIATLSLPPQMPVLALMPYAAG